MGMFDYVRCEVDLPNRPVQDKDELFQTKDFANMMETYVICQNGQIYRERWDYDWQEDEGSMFGGYFNKVEGSFRREYLTDCEGEITFYNSIPLSNGQYRWVEYTARFTNGKLESIKYETTNT